MEITDQMIEKLADLAKLDFSQKEDKDKIKKDLERMLQFFSAIEKIDVADYKPMIHPVQNQNILRSDEAPFQNMPQEKALQNATFKDTDYFRVPKMMEE